MRKSALLICCVLTGCLCFAQDRAPRELTLDECINIALNNNLDIKQARNNELIGKIQ